MFFSLLSKLPHVSTQAPQGLPPNAEKLDKRGTDFVSLHCHPEDIHPPFVIQRSFSDEGSREALVDAYTWM